MWQKFPLRNLPERCFVHRKVDSHVATGWKRDGYTAALCFRWVFKMWKHFVSSFVNNRFLLLLRVVYRPFSQPDNNASFRSFQRIGESQILVSFNLIFVFIIYWNSRYSVFRALWLATQRQDIQCSSLIHLQLLRKSDANANSRKLRPKWFPGLLP